MYSEFQISLKKDSYEDEPMDGKRTEDSPDQTIEWKQRFRQDELLSERCLALEMENQALKEKISFLRQPRMRRTFSVGTQSGETLKEVEKEQKEKIQKEINKANDLALLHAKQIVGKPLNQTIEKLKAEITQLKQQLLFSQKENEKLRSDANRAKEVASEEVNQLSRLLAQKDQDIWSLNESLIQSRVDNSANLGQLKKEHEHMLGEELAKWKESTNHSKFLHASTIDNITKQFNFEKTQLQKANEVLLRQVEQYSKMVKGLREAQAIEKDKNNKKVKELSMKVASLSAVVASRRYETGYSASNESDFESRLFGKKGNILGTHETPEADLTFQRRESDFVSFKDNEESLKLKHSAEISMYVKEMAMMSNKMSEMKGEILGQDQRIEELEKKNQFLNQQCRSLRISVEVAMAKLKNK